MRIQNYYLFLWIKHRETNITPAFSGLGHNLHFITFFERPIP